jgi:hypothetical protein
MHTQFKFENLWGRDHVEEVGIGGRIMLKVDVEDVSC